MMMECPKCGSEGWIGPRYGSYSDEYGGSEWLSWKCKRCSYAMNGDRNGPIHQEPVDGLNYDRFMYYALAVLTIAMVMAVSYFWATA
jgi:transposase-like protein